MNNLLFEKKVDQSLLKSGLTVPVYAQARVQDALGVQLSKGDKVEIKIIPEGNSYDANEGCKLTLM